jgi:hypothetical protein
MAILLGLAIGILAVLGWAVICDYREQHARLRRMEEWAAQARFPRSAPLGHDLPGRGRTASTRVELPRPLDHQAVMERISHLPSSGGRGLRGLRRDGRRAPARKPEFPHAGG